MNSFNVRNPHDSAKTQNNIRASTGTVGAGRSRPRPRLDDPPAPPNVFADYKDPRSRLRCNPNRGDPGERTIQSAKVYFHVFEFIPATPFQTAGHVCMTSGTRQGGRHGGKVGPLERQCGRLPESLVRTPKLRDPVIGHDMNRQGSGVDARTDTAFVWWPARRNSRQRDRVCRHPRP